MRWGADIQPISRQETYNVQTALKVKAYWTNFEEE